MEIKAELLKPYTEEEKIEFIVEQNHKNGYEIKETDFALEAWGYTDKEKEQEEKKRVAMLKMTPRDFLLAITQMGVDFAKIKELMATNPQVEIELNYCNYVYRGNALLDQLCGQFGITTTQLDELFKSKGS